MELCYQTKSLLYVAKEPAENKKKTYVFVEETLVVGITKQLVCFPFIFVFYTGIV